MAEEHYANIREVIGYLIDKRVVDVTQHDKEEWDGGSESYIMLMFDDGSWLKCWITDLGFDHNNGSEPDEPEGAVQPEEPPK